MHAVILRDIRSRYFNHGLGFLIAPLFPVAHIGVLILIYSIMGRDAVFGDDLKLFFATGLVPVLTLMYISRFMSHSLLANKNMLAFPSVKLIDIVLARSVLEFLAIIISTLFIVIILLSLGVNPLPNSPADAYLCISITAILAVGVGVIVSVFTAIAPMVSLAYSLFTVLVYLSSGAPIYFESLPSEVLYYFSFNPAYQVVTWMRSAYYVGYPVQHLDKTYLVMWAMCSLAVGLLLERALRRVLQSGR